MKNSDEENVFSMADIISYLASNGISAERKGIYNDMELLRQFGLDIIFRKEEPSGYYIGSREFELAELKLLVDAVWSSKFITDKKSKELIRKIHDKGAKVLMSSHVLKYIPAERVLEIALEHQNRGADICKIVTCADTMEEQIENLKIINMLKENLKIPFLFLSGGECSILRRIGGELGCCMYLCVHEYDELATPQQPLLQDVKTIRDTMTHKC